MKNKKSKQNKNKNKKILWIQMEYCLTESSFLKLEEKNFLFHNYLIKYFKSSAVRQWVNIKKPKNQQHCQRHSTSQTKNDELCGLLRLFLHAQGSILTFFEHRFLFFPLLLQTSSFIPSFDNCGRKVVATSKLWDLVPERSITEVLEASKESIDLNVDCTSEFAVVVCNSSFRVCFCKKWKLKQGKKYSSKIKNLPLHNRH